MKTPPIFETGRLAEVFGWTLFHSLWQGLAIALLLYGLLWLVRGARHRYALSMAALALFLLVPLCTFTWLASQLPAATSVYAFAPADAPALVWGQVTEAPAVAIPGPWWADWQARFAQLSPWLFMAWLSGGLFFMLRWTGALLYLQRLRQASLFPESPQWQDKLHGLARRVGVRRVVHLRVSSWIQTPLTMGHFRPVILLPMGMLTGMDPAQIQAILLHELAHIRRYDFLLNIFQALAESLLFYHPAYWWISARIHEAREHSCDDLAVAHCGNALVYARALTEIETRKQTTSSLTPLLAPSLAGRRRHELLARIRRLVQPEPVSTPVHLRLLLMSSLVLAVSGLAWLAPELRREITRADDPIGNGWYLAEMPGLVCPLPAAQYAAWSAQPGYATIAPLMMPRVPQLIVVCDTPPPAPLPPAMPAPPAPPVAPAPPTPPTPPAPPHRSPSEGSAAWEAYSRSMEAWSRAYEQSMEPWSREMEAWGEQMEAWGRQMEERGQTFRGPQPDDFQFNFDFSWDDGHRIIWHDSLGVDSEWRRTIDAEIAAAVEQACAHADQIRVELGPEHSAELRRMIDRERLEALRQAEQLRIQTQREHEMLRREEQMRQQELQRMYREEARARADWHREQARLQALSETLHTLEHDLLRQLRRDGLLSGDVSRVELKFGNNSLKVNGQKVEGERYDRYMDLLRRYDIEIGAGSSLILNND
ncbi:MAG: hypothetical protein OHK0039_06190 [Bacteroidia bacterium]